MPGLVEYQWENKFDPVGEASGFCGIAYYFLELNDIGSICVDFVKRAWARIILDSWQGVSM